jgi:hypothetical protein
MSNKHIYVHTVNGNREPTNPDYRTDTVMLISRRCPDVDFGTALLVEIRSFVALANQLQ